jgi:hypothetical protein
MTPDAAPESTGAAGKAQALAHRNDANTTPAKARADVFDIVPSPFMVDEMNGCTRLSLSTNRKFNVVCRRRFEPDTVKNCCTAYTFAFLEHFTFQSGILVYN